MPSWQVVKVSEILRPTGCTLVDFQVLPADDRDRNPVDDIDNSLCIRLGEIQSAAHESALSTCQSADAPRRLSGRCAGIHKCHHHGAAQRICTINGSDGAGPVEPILAG